MLSPPVCLVSSCPFCLVLSALSRPVRLASSCLVLSVLSRPVRLCLVLSVFCPPDLVLSVLPRLVSSCSSCLGLSVCVSSCPCSVRLISSRPSCLVLSRSCLLLLVLSGFSGPVRLCFLYRPDRLCLLSRHVRFVSSCPFLVFMVLLCISQKKHLLCAIRKHG